MVDVTAPGYDTVTPDAAPPPNLLSLIRYNSLLGGPPAEAPAQTAPQVTVATNTATAAARGPAYPSNLWTVDRFKSGILAGEGSKPTDPGGVWQVVDSTALDPGFGIAPVKSLNDLNERNRVGEQYAEAVFNKYGPILGAVAYNAGPGFVDKMIAKLGDPRADKAQISMDDWINRAAPEAKLLKGSPDIKRYLARVAGGSLALPAQTPPSQTQVATNMDQSQPKNPLAMAPPSPPFDMRQMMLMTALQTLLPKGFAFHPVDYDPMKVLERGRMAPPAPLGSFERPSVRQFEPVTAIRPQNIPRFGQRGPTYE